MRNYAEKVIDRVKNNDLQMSLVSTNKHDTLI